MEANSKKLFVGGISWDTDEDHLMNYFKKYGEVEEAIVIRDRATGRSRGFGFIVFSDPAIAEHVIMEMHMIGGRMVEAKKAIPRDDWHGALNNSHGSAHGSQRPKHTKKIFVGGLASTVTKEDFTKYFKQFGTITDVVVVYDHQTQRHRGFGFITYDSEDAVDRALFNTFHKLKGKRVDVKHAIPKEPSRRPSFLNGYTQCYNTSPLGCYGMRMDECSGLPSGVNNGYTSFGGSYGIGMNFDPWMNPCIESGSSFNSDIQHGWHLNPYYNGNSGGLNNYVSHGEVNDNNGLVFDSRVNNLWGNFGLNHSSSSTSLTFGNRDFSGIGNNSVDWENPYRVLPLGANNCSVYCTENISYGSSETNFGQGSNVYGRNVGSSAIINTINPSTNGYARNFRDSLVGGVSIYGDTTWRFGSFEHDETNPLGYELQDNNDSTTYMGH